MLKYLSVEDRYGKELAGHAASFRDIAFEIDENPDAILKYDDCQFIAKLILSDNMQCIERVKIYEALAYGDPGVLLACPGPSLAGLVVNELGNKTQKEIFYQHVLTNSARTFLAVTEPNVGSNLSLLSTALHVSPTSSNRYIIQGEKWLVGHGATGSIGVLIARIAPGPLGLVAILLTPELLKKNEGLEQETLKRMVFPMVGLKGARLGRLIFNNFIVPKENILGLHLSATHRGMMTLIKTFNRMRPCVGAMAVGLAQAVLDYIFQNKKNFSIDEETYFKNLIITVNLARQLLHSAAMNVDQNPYDSELSSLAKLKAVRVAEEVTLSTFKFFKRAMLLEHPWVAKWHKDVWGFEYMEGTQHMQLMNIFHSVQQSLLRA